MSEWTIGIIGGSGLYAIDALEEAQWIAVDTPWGAASDALLAMKHNLLAMSDGNALPSESEEEVGKKSKPRKSRKAA